jgi:hypothetical protein
VNLHQSVADQPGPRDEREWYGHALIGQNICPLHPGQSADECEHGCTWMTPIHRSSAVTE